MRSNGPKFVVPLPKKTGQIDQTGDVLAKTMLASAARVGTVVTGNVVVARQNALACGRLE